MTNFQSQNSHTNLLFRKTFVLKFEDKINLENILFISKSINNLLPSLFTSIIGLFFPLMMIHTNTSWSSDDKLQKYSYRTKNLIIISAIESWNNSQNNLKTLFKTSDTQQN